MPNNSLRSLLLNLNKQSTPFNIIFTLVIDAEGCLTIYKDFPTTLGRDRAMIYSSTAVKKVKRSLRTLTSFYTACNATNA